ncbi:zinc-dependent alcohol dehydrogenase [Maribellus mangrovi]|uniref:zinc-dependent alcohol dehydrogenase n=1 Tax=Maribellus mangrovi TaxID=3133146 RepID=UPI0030EC61C3
MKQVVLQGIKKMKLIDVDEPQLMSADEVKIRLSVVGVCGSDIHYYSEGKIGSQVVEFPFPVGHECSGTIVEKGANVKHVNLGDLVVVDPSVHCGECDQCRSGRPHTCRNNRFLGCPGQLDGCLGDYIVMPAFTCFPVTGSLNPVQAALIEPLSIGVYAVKLASLVDNKQSVAIFGAGPIGLSILFKLLADDVREITMIEPLDYRLNQAKEIGASHAVQADKENVVNRISEIHESLLDVVFEASGEQEAVDIALKVLKPGGKLVLVGIPPDAKYTFDMDLMRRKELSVINVRRQNHCVEEAIELVRSGRVDAEKMVTHNFKLEETGKAFEIVEAYKDGAIKAMIHFE